MSGTDLLEREQQAGNEADNLNPGDRAYHNQVDGSHEAIEGHDRDGDGFDDIVNHLDFGHRGSTHVDSHGDTVQNNPNSNPDPNENIASTRDKENNPAEAGWNTTVGKESTDGSPAKGLGSMQINVKGKKGPTGSVVGMLLGGGAVVTVTLSPGMLLVQMKEVFHNDQASATRTSLLMTRAMLAVAFKANHINDPCNGKSKISCQLGSASKSLIQKYKEAGFKVDAVEVDADGKETGKNATDMDPADPATDQNRYKVNTLEFPDGHVSSDGADFSRYTDSNPSARRVAVNADNGRSGNYLTQQFRSTLVERLKIASGKQATNYTEGETDEAKAERARQFNATTGGSSEADAEANARRVSDEVRSETEERANRGGAAAKVGGVTSFIQTVCAGYKGTTIGLAAVKSKHMLRLANFAMEFLKVADMIKAGVATATAVSYLSDRLTYVERNEYLENGEKNPKYNLSATDSQGYRIAAHGDMTGLALFAEKYVLGYDGEGGLSLSTKALLGATAATTALEAATGVFVNAVTPGPGIDGKDALKNVCRTAGSLAAIAAQCTLLATQSLAAIGTTGPFGAATTVIGLKMCQCAVMSNQVIDTILQSAAGVPTCEDIQGLIGLLKKGLIAATAGAVAAAAESVIRNWNIGSDTKGVDAGNAIAAGAGIILTSAATSYALKPTTKSNYKSYITYTDPYVEKIAELDKEDAKSTPFDTSNKYSFVSSLIRSVKIEDTSSSTAFGGVFNLLNVVPTALSTQANALYTNPVQEQEQRYDCNTEDKIKDEGLDYLGVDGDKFCTILPDTPQKELKGISTQEKEVKSTYFQDTRQWMEDEQNKSEDDGGTADDGDGCEKGCDGEPSIDGDGKPNPDSQYQKWITYCSEKREDPWGFSSHPFEEGSDRDQDWFTGKQCLKESDMLVNFRTWHKICAEIAKGKGTLNCWDSAEAAAVPSSTCAGGGPTAIYTCALKYDNYQYKWGGGHGDVPDAKKWIDEFNAGKVPEWESILDCSGIVRMAYVEAMGVEDQAYVAEPEYETSKHWQKISLEEATQGDIVTSSGHVAIVQSNDPAAKTFKIFHSSTPGSPKEDNILHGTQSYGSTVSAFRATKG
ncbi:hypothetical protein A2707_04350 [Candidatus Saccharibacteria bacterium RIFCSPHIGHO2_01_FULL_45_15]|nr:MAG: hypothetical protein A2707_04350 [Candidatus Saccharibacteria bacterium RIFCSPHIGHO2_01_FULL_45_15]OGL27171.1 MAG: hypothetical protein A3C39_01245 [Candidatus Saccharibacteria bacterium RIFCSPHIGHO2_02_FULL_46_12]OGL32789.1 MAG: hypothetical protein A3E76_05610 [Candidatus Saccharibacteria bacterium RIFCSPHIGHO2_12_FULL_44_22]